MDKNYIICVDDERIVLSCLEEQLKCKFGMEYNIETATCGYDALKLFQNLTKDNKKVPVFISDYVMPDIDGAELLEYVYGMSPDTKSILISGHITLDRIKNVVNKANLFKCIEKPWNRDKLYEAVRQAIEHFEENELFISVSKNKSNDSMDVIIEKLEAAGNVSCDMNNIAMDIKNSISLIKNSLEIVNNNHEKSKEEDIDYYMRNLKKFYSKISELIGNVVNNFEISMQRNEIYSNGKMLNNISRETTDMYNNLFEKVNSLIERIDNKETEKNNYNNESVVSWKNGEIFILKVEDILLFCSEKNDIIAVTKEDSYKIKKSLDNLEKDFKGTFFRSHRSYLVNLNYISKISPWMGSNSYILKLNYYNEDIPISRDRVKDMKKILGIKK